MTRRRKQREPADGRIDVQIARRSYGRAKALFWLTFALAGYLGWRLYDVQIVHGPALAAKAFDQQSARIPVEAERGTIYASDGVMLARSLPSHNVHAAPAAIKDVAATVAALATVLQAPAALLTERIHLAATDHEIARNVSDAQAGAVAKLGLPGISVVEDPSGVRFVPSGRLASTILGFVGRDKGLEGVEFGFDRLLRGAGGVMSVQTDGFTRSLPFAKPRWLEAPRAGDGIVLTLDSYLQYATERVLRRTVAQYSAASGTAIVMDPNTGALLAVANVPDYDVNEYDRFSQEDRRDRAVTDTYEPGSTFKLVTATAALESGKVTTASRFPARDEIEVAGSVIHNAEDGLMASAGGTESLEEIVALSHNVGAAEVGLTIGSKALSDTMHAFGFDGTTNADLPGESAGLVPALADWSATSLPTMSFGHGIAITPIALARAYAAIANGGLLLRPRILDAILDRDGRVIYRYGREIERRVMSAKTAATLRSFMRAVVLHGTGAAARVPGFTTAGKTGTAQVASGGHYASGEYIASFVGVIPAEHPRFVILVKVERPRGAIYGGVVAAPAFAELARLAMLHAGVTPSASPAPSPLPDSDPRGSTSKPHA